MKTDLGAVLKSTMSTSNSKERKPNSKTYITHIRARTHARARTQTYATHARTHTHTHTEYMHHSSQVN